METGLRAEMSPIDEAADIKLMHVISMMTKDQKEK